MTERQRRFAEFYLESGNARQAAVRAGYSINYAGHAVEHKEVKEYLASRRAAYETRRVASADEVLEFLTEVMRMEDVTATRLHAAEMLASRMGYVDSEAQA